MPLFSVNLEPTLESVPLGTLVSARRKVERARSIYAELEVEVQDFLIAKHYEVVQEWNEDHTLKQARLSITQSLPPYWPLWFGDIIHNLRSALDHAIYDLSALHSGRIVKGTEFPIYFDQGQYHKEMAQKKIRGLPQRVKDEIDSIQPFNDHGTGDNGMRNISVLEIVHRLDIVDKHRTINLVYMSVGEGGWQPVRTIEHAEVHAYTYLADGIILGKWRPTIMDDNDDVRYDFTCDVALADSIDELPDLSGNSVLKLAATSIAGVNRVLDRLVAANDQTDSNPT